MVWDDEARTMVVRTRERRREPFVDAAYLTDVTFLSQRVGGQNEFSATLDGQPVMVMTKSAGCGCRGGG